MLELVRVSFKKIGCKKAMTFEEYTDNVWRMTSHGRGEITTCYIVECGSNELVLIDSGSNERMGREIVRSMGQFSSGLELTNIILTHSHPEILGGLATIKKAFPDVKINIHESAKQVFEEGRKYVSTKQFPLDSPGSKITLAWKSPIFENYINLPKEINYLSGNDDLKIDDETFIIQPSGGHSSDSIIIHAYNAKATFIGDEIGIYDNNEYSFFFDLTGSPDRRSKALHAVQKLKSKFVFSSNLSPIENAYLDEEVEAAILAQEHFETTLRECLLGYDSARLSQIVDHVYSTLNIEWKSPYAELKVQESTIMRYLEMWKKNELVTYNEQTKKYSYDKNKLGDDYDPYAPY